MENGSNKPQPPHRRDYNDPSHYSAIPPRASRRRQQEPERQRQRADYYADEQADEAYDDYDDRHIYEDEEEFERPARSMRSMRTQSPAHRPQRRHKRRSLWPAFMAGCGLSVLVLVIAASVVVLLTLHTFQGTNSLPILGSHAFTHTDKQTVNLPSLTHLQVCDKVGNVSINVDPAPDASSITISSQKIVQAGSQNEADQQFKQLMVEIQPPATLQNKLACSRPAPLPTPIASTDDQKGLIVNVTLPNSNTILPNAANSVDINILIPRASLPQNGPTLSLDVEAPLGKVLVNGLGGALYIRGGTGDVVVQHAILANGSDIETGQGNVTFSGLLAMPPDPQARIILRCEKGNIDVTLPQDLNLTLDSNTNAGTIKSDFAIQVDNGNGGLPVSYHGPLNSSINLKPGTLVLDVSLGNVVVHKQQSQN